MATGRASSSRNFLNSSGILDELDDSEGSDLDLEEDESYNVDIQDDDSDLDGDFIPHPSDDNCSSDEEMEDGRSRSPLVPAHRLAASNRGMSRRGRGHGRRGGRGRARGSREAAGDRGQPGLAQRDQTFLTDTEKVAGWSEFTPEVVEGTDVIFQENIPEFTVRTTGPINIPPDCKEPIDFFSLFLTTTLLGIIVRETNRYAASVIAGMGELRPSSRYRRWKNVTIADIRKYFGLHINMGLIRKKLLYDYWKQAYPSQDTPYFRSVMSYDRFSMINRMLHLSDNSRQVQRGEPGFDPWYKIRSLIDEMNSNFKQYFVPDKLISIDESMVGMKNRTVYIQYMPNKRHSRFGIKKFQLCDSATGYVQHVELYCGRDFDLNSDEGQATAVVKHLLDKCNLLQKGYHLLTDNFYTRVKLAQDLHAQKTLLTGTVRTNSKEFLKSLFHVKLAVQAGAFAKNGDLQALAFRDKPTQRKPVCVLTSGVDTKLNHYQKHNKEVTKPSPITLYNKGMDGVDLMDRKVYHISAERPAHRYWVKIFFNFIDIALRNSYEIYKKVQPESNISCHDFIAQVVESMCAKSDLFETPDPPNTDHKLTTLPGKSERDCVVCSNRQLGIRRRSRTYCASCDVGVHKGCFEQLEHFRRV